MALTAQEKYDALSTEYDSLVSSLAYDISDGQRRIVKERMRDIRVEMTHWETKVNSSGANGGPATNYGRVEHFR